ncbi:hypothetical protein HK103_007294 [Boothiomyces macroporosus]|uniref:Uncharacterized protein n=1 Tax=Boothiomyces macroporosus TaxID=261099 RepID=A0AAD5Y606_9FUNG|nr:hypothetical protein HK103_007294 [Boothiomyces macroporosus]
MNSLLSAFRRTATLNLKKYPRPVYSRPLTSITLHSKKVDFSPVKRLLPSLVKEFKKPYSTRKHSTITMETPKLPTVVTGLSIIGGITLVPLIIPVLSASMAYSASILVLAMTLGATYSLLTSILLLLTIAAVIIAIPTYDLYCEAKKITRLGRITSDWTVVPFEDRGIISYANHEYLPKKIRLNDIDEELKQNEFYELYEHVGTILSRQTSFKGTVSLQKNCFGWYKYSIPFDLDSIRMKNHEFIIYQVR